jgi:D-alanyl-lipoteichoic acid acyltransferase DltB (MBOAT superfamily)
VQVCTRRGLDAPLWQPFLPSCASRFRKVFMLFPTLQFALFFVVVFAAAWGLRGHNEARKGLLLAASYFFYGYWDWRFLFLLAASSAFNYGAGLAIARTGSQTRRKWLTGAAVAFNLVCLGFFKLGFKFEVQLPEAR